MARTDLKILSTNAGTGQKITTTISHVNPNANSSLLRQLGTSLNALTTNNYAETNRVQTVNVDTEEVTTLKEGTATIIDNPTYSRVNSLITMPVSNLIINGKQYTTLPSTINLMGTAHNNTTYKPYILTKQTDSTISWFRPDVTPAAEAGAYIIQLCIREPGYTPAYLYFTIQVQE